MADDEFIEVWFMWNDGRRKVSGRMPEFYLGKNVSIRGSAQYEFCDLTKSPHLAEIKAIADLVGECDDSKGRIPPSVPWSNEFTIPVEWASGWWGDIGG